MAGVRVVNKRRDEIDALLTEEFLRREYRENRRSAADIAAELGVGKRTVLERLRALGWQRPPSADGRRRALIADQLSEEFLRRGYERGGLSAQDIARQVGVSTVVVTNHLRRHGIAVRPRVGERRGFAPLEQTLTGGYLRREYERHGRTLPDLAREHHTSTDKVRAALVAHGIAVRAPVTAPLGAEVEALLTREFFEREYVEERRSMKEVGHLVGVSTKIVRKHLDLHGISVRKQGVSRHSLANSLTKTRFVELYVDGGRSIDEIAGLYAVSPITVGQLRRRYGMEPVGRVRRSRYEDRLTRQYLTDAYLTRGLTMKQIASETGIAYTTVRDAVVGHGIALRRRGDRPGGASRRLTREYLVAEYVENGRSITDIAVGLRASKTSVTAALKREGIPMRARAGRYDKVLSAEFLEREYLRNGRSSTDIALLVGCSPETVLRRLDTLGIQRRAHTGRLDPRTQKLTKKFLEREYTQKQRSITDIAVQAGLSHPTVVAALARHGVDQRESNVHVGRRNAQTFTKPYLVAEYLVEKRRTSDIAAEHGVSTNTVVRYLHLHGISLRPDLGPTDTLAGVLTKKYLRKRYLRDRATLAEIANEIGTTASTVLRYTRIHGIETRSRSHRAN